MATDTEKIKALQRAIELLTTAQDELEAMSSAPALTEPEQAEAGNLAIQLALELKVLEEDLADAVLGQLTINPPSAGLFELAKKHAQALGKLIDLADRSVKLINAVTRLLDTWSKILP